MSDDAPRETSQSPEPAPRYCKACGEIFTAGETRCPNCGAAWSLQSHLTVAAVASLLTEFHGLRDAGVLAGSCYAALRTTYERRLVSMRPPRRPRPDAVQAPTGRAIAPVGTGARLSAAVALADRPSPTPARPLGAVLAQWTAERQADILLYLGAFFLSIAALIFVGYQGEALSGPVRFAVLLGYTVGFLALGVSLPRWERVREAGAVFLALGAVLVPVNFIALRTQVLGDSNVPDDVLWLAGAAAAAGLYFTLAGRGFGWLYALPGAAAAVVGWGALGSVLNLPEEWFGAWYVLAAAVLSGAPGVVRHPAARWLEPGAAVLGVGGLVYAHAAAAFGTGDTAQLPVAYALATVGAAAGVYGRRSPGALAAPPPLTALTALTAWWSAFGLAPAWYGCFAAAAALGYLVVAHFDRPARARTWGTTAAILGGLALLFTHNIMLGGGADRAALPSAYALVVAGAIAGSVRWRRREALAAVPSLATATGAAAGWAFWGMPLEWLGCWAAGAGLGYLAIAEPDAGRRREWRGAAATAAGLGLAWAHGQALVPDTAAAQLPLTYGIVLAGAAWDGVRRQDAGLLALPALGAMLGASILWAVGAAPQWWIYPGLAAALIIFAAEPWWRHRPVLAAAGWPYLLAATVALPLAFAPLYGDRPAHGLAAFATAAAVLLGAALRVRGALARLLGATPDERILTIERQMLARAGGAFLYGAAAYFNAWAGLDGSARAWVYAGLGMAAWAGLALAGRVRGDLFGILAPAGVAAMALAAVIAGSEPGMATLVLALGAVAPAAAFPTTRRWPLWGIAAVFGAAALGAAWEWRGLDFADLPLAYAALAGLLWAGLTPIRRYESGERGAVVAGLAWTPWALAVGLAVVLLDDRRFELAGRDALARTREWAVLAIAAASGAVAVTAEGVRLRRRMVWVGGTGGLLAALLMAIAMSQPENVQAYTVPAGIYFVVLGLTWRRSRKFFGAHMLAHEAVVVLGLLCLILPPAEQSFAPGGAVYGLELIGLGLLFLLVGFTLSARWLVSGSVLTLSGVAVRWLTIFGREAPYWLTLGLVGMALLGVGMLLLLQRERWERARRRIGRWWLETPAGWASPPDPLPGKFEG